MAFVYLSTQFLPLAKQPLYLYICHQLKLNNNNITNMKTRILLVSLAVIMITGGLFAQTKPDWRKLHYLSEEEMNTPLTKSRTFYATDPPEGEIRNVAEYDHMQSVLIRYPFGIPMELIREMAEDIIVLTIVANSSQQQTVTTQYQNNNVNMDNCEFLIAPTDSYWTRDYGPWFVFDGDNIPGIVNFPYNRPRPNDDDIPIRVAEYLDIDLYGMDLYHTGGNYMCTGKGISASTDLVWEENTAYTHEQIGDLVNDYLGNSLFDVVEDPLGEYIKHIDCWSKYLSPGKVMVGQVPETDWRYQDFEDAANHFATTMSSYGKPWEVYRVFTPGTSPNTPYTNTLILNNKVFVPLTGSQWDDEAMESWQAAMPGYEIVGILYNGWENTDALHCRTKGIADIGMLYIEHMPTLGTVQYHPEYDINANITAASGATIYSDSVLIYYKINDGDYTTALMTHDSASSYTGTITGVMPNDTVSYYLYAADNSGRQSKQPYIGEPDPFVFKNIYFPTTEIMFDPDTVKFMDYNQMLDGKQLHIINQISDPVTITYITEEGYQFPWFVEQMPDLPYVIEEGDSLTLTIMCPVITSKGALIIDTMFVDTQLEPYQTIIAIDSDLVSASEIVIKENISVYPNPFKDEIRFDITNTESETCSVQIFNITGNMIFERIISTNLNSSESVLINFDEEKISSPGSYYYRITSGKSIKTGKLIKLD